MMVVQQVTMVKGAFSHQHFLYATILSVLQAPLKMPQGPDICRVEVNKVVVGLTLM
jgi:hypothetical protein